MKVAKYEEAVKEFQKALQLDPNNFQAQDALEEAKVGEKRKQNLKEQLEKHLGDNGNTRRKGGPSKAKNDNAPPVIN